MQRTELYADPRHLFLHDLVLDSCRRNPARTAIIDTSCGRRLTYAEYGQTVETVSRGLIAAGVKPGEVIAIFLSNSWEFCATFHAAQLAGADSYLAESHIPRTRSAISVGQLRRGPPDHRWRKH